MDKSLMGRFWVRSPKVEPAADALYAQLGRRIYVSPKSYLDFLHTFLNMLRDRRNELSTRLSRYQTEMIPLMLESHDVVSKYATGIILCILHSSAF